MNIRLIGREDQSGTSAKYRGFFRGIVRNWTGPGGTPLPGLQPTLSTGLNTGHHQLPFDEWTEVFGSERLTGALLDCLTHHVHI